MMGKRRKALDPVVKTHRRYFKLHKNGDNSDILLWENVTEYDLTLLTRALGTKWQVMHACIDPQLFGLPASRTRLYVLAFRKDRLAWHPDVPDLRQLLRTLTSRVHRDFTCDKFWWSPKQTHRLSHADAPPSDPCFLFSRFICNIAFHVLLARDRREAANLKQYSKHMPKKVIVDLSQMAKNGRGRGATPPDPLPTLLTSSGRMFHKASCRQCVLDRQFA